MNLFSGSQSIQPPLPGSTWIPRHLLGHKVPKKYLPCIKVSTEIFQITFWQMFKLSSFPRTGFNNIVPYNATRQGMPGYELPGVLRDPLMTVDPKTFYKFKHGDDGALLQGGPHGKVWQLHVWANRPDGGHCHQVGPLPVPLPHRVLLDRGRGPPHHVGEDRQKPEVNYFMKYFWLAKILKQYLKPISV